MKQNKKAVAGEGSDFSYRDRNRSAGYTRHLPQKNADKERERRGGASFEIFEDGEYRKEMPKLFAEKFFPATAEHIMMMQWETYPSRGELSFHEKFSTSSGIAHAAGDAAGGDRFKIIPYCTELEKVDGDAMDYRGGIKSLEYEAIRGREFTHDDMLLDTPLTENEALAHIGLLRLVRNDKYILGQIVGNVYREAYDGYGMKKAMGLYLKKGNAVANVRPVSIRPIEAGYGITDFEGLGIMDKARLVGLRSREKMLEVYAPKHQERNDSAEHEPSYKFRH